MARLVTVRDLGNRRRPPSSARIQGSRGGAAVKSSNVFHCSRPNRSRVLRRALLAQYIAEPVRGEDGRQIHFADPLVDRI